MNAKKIAAFAVGPIAGAALGFITLPIITWFYSAEDIGRIAMLQVMSSFFILLFSLGLDQAYVREYHEAQQKPELLKATLLPGLLLLLVGLLICLLIPGLISKALFSVDSIQISWLIATCIISAFVSRFLSLILRMQEKGLAFSMSQVLPKILFLFIIGSYYLTSLGFDFLQLVTAHTLSTLAITFVYAWNTRKEWLTAINHKINTTKLKAMLRYGMPLIMGGAAFWGLTAMDKVFLRNLSTFEELGIYSVTTSFAAAATIFQSIFSTVWAPTVYKWAAEGVNAKKIDQVTDHVLAAVVFLFVLTGMFSWIVTYLLPDSYEKVQYILVACMAFPLFYTLSETTVVGLGVTRKSGYGMLASLIAVLFNLIANYLLVPTYGASGAAISTALAFWIFLVCRTELSCLAWRKVPRAKLYALTLICLIAAIANACFAEYNKALMIVTWAIIGATAVLAFKATLNSARLEIFKILK